MEELRDLAEATRDQNHPERLKVRKPLVADLLSVFPFCEHFLRLQGLYRTVVKKSSSVRQHAVRPVLCFREAASGVFQMPMPRWRTGCWLPESGLCFTDQRGGGRVSEARTFDESAVSQQRGGEGEAAGCLSAGSSHKRAFVPSKC